MSNLEFNEIIATPYQRPEIENGYTGQTLSVDLSANAFTFKTVSDEMKRIFIGGKGFDLWLLWQAVNPETRWNSPENTICIASGPMGGTPAYPGSGKSIVTAISPLTDMVIDSNVGGYFGPYLKFSGFDALEITGKAATPSLLLIDGIDASLKLFEMSGLPDGAYDLSARLTERFSDGNPTHISVVSTGPGARHTRFGCLNFSWYDNKRKRARYKQAGRGGIGTVFADKGLVAIVARWDKVPLNVNKPADTESSQNRGQGLLPGDRRSGPQAK